MIMNFVCLHGQTGESRSMELGSLEEFEKDLFMSHYFFAFCGVFNKLTFPFLCFKLATDKICLKTQFKMAGYNFEIKKKKKIRTLSTKILISELGRELHQR